MFSYKKFKDTATLTSYNGNEKIVHIPDIINDLKVTKITAMCFFGNEEVEEIHFPDNISIENNAVVDCPNLKTIYVSNVSRLGNFVEDCDEVQIVVNNPTTSKKLNKKNLENIVDLSIFQTTENEDGTLKITNILNLKKKNGPKVITIPNYINGKKVTKLAERLFEDATIEEITLNDFIEELPRECFMRTVAQTIKNMSHIKKVGEYCFYYCVLKNGNVLNFENLEYVENCGFYCSYFPIKVGKNIRELKRSAFAFANIEEISLLKHIDILPDYAFADCKNLKKIILPKTIKELGNNSISHCINLVEIKNIDKVKIFGMNCLDRSSSFKFNVKFDDGRIFMKNSLCKVLLPRKLLIGDCTLGEGTFSNCDCTEVIFTDNYKLDYVPSHLFGYFPNLKKVTLNKNIKIIKERAFEGVKLIHINLENIEIIETLALARTNIKEVTLNKLKEAGRNVFDGCKYLRKVDMENSTLEILSNGFFRECKNLEELKLPKTLKEIEAFALSKVGLKSFTIPFGVETLGINCFANNEKLRYLEIPSTITSFGYDCFYDLKKIVFKFNGCVNLSNVEGVFKCTTCDILDLSSCSMKKIGHNAFHYFKANKLILPKDVVEIGSGAFIHATINELVIDYDLIEAVRGSAFMFSNIKGLQVPKNTRIFNDNCYYNANLKLKKIELEKVDIIGGSAFYSVGKIDELVINTNPTKLESGNFVKCGIKKISSTNSKVLTRLKTRKAIKISGCTFEKIK